MDQDKKEKLKKIKDEVIDLKDSPLCQERIKNKYLPVIGEGNHFADILFVGEAPGKNEALQGRPFCGRAGDILNELLKDISLAREDVYITNILKDRPPDNRDPLPNEIEIYAPFLDRQINIIQPKVIATLGRFAMNYCLKRYTNIANLPTISEAHGGKFEAKMEYGKINIIALYHPAATIYNNSLKETLREDFQVLEK